MLRAVLFSTAWVMARAGESSSKGAPEGVLRDANSKPRGSHISENEMWAIRPANCPTQAKGRLEWATGPVLGIVGVGVCAIVRHVAGQADSLQR